MDVNLAAQDAGARADDWPDALLDEPADEAAGTPSAALEQAAPPAHAAARPAPLPARPFHFPRLLACSACPTLHEYLARHDAAHGMALVQRRLGEVRLPPADQEFFAHYPETLHLVAVVSPHLPDTPAVLPLWARIAAACPRVDLRVLDEADGVLLDRILADEPHDLREAVLEAMDQPLLLLFDAEWQLRAQWGPRPHAAEPSIDEWLAHHPRYETLSAADAEGTLTPEQADELAALADDLVLQMRLWYNSGLDAEGSAELRALFASLLDAHNELP